MMRRVQTGIPGLDSLIEGGLVSNSVNLISGATGTGKTLMGCQYIWHGLEKGDPGVFITLEEDPENIRADALQFGWDFSKYEKKGLFRLVYHDPAQVNNLGAVLVNEIKNVNAQRLVIDSTTVMGLNIESQSQIRRKLFNLISAIKSSTSTTALITAEIPEDSKALSTFGVEEFVCDGVIVLYYLGIGGETTRSLAVRKMRRTSHGNDIYPLHFTKSGLSVRKTE